MQYPLTLWSNNNAGPTTHVCPIPMKPKIDGSLADVDYLLIRAEEKSAIMSCDLPDKDSIVSGLGKHMHYLKLL
jgi:hypothetical protein